MREHCHLPQSIGVVGFPFSKGQPRTGAELGPGALREAGLVSQLESLGNHVIDFGDVELEPVSRDEPVMGVKNPLAVGTANKKLSDAVTKLLKQNQSIITLGGDHSMAIGSIHGHAQVEPDLVIVWVDAHADIHTPLTSPSGNIHGMPLSFLARELQDYVPDLPGFDWCSPCISVHDIAYIGLRDVDPAERAIIEKFGICSYSMQEVDKFGIREVVDRALQQLDPSGTRPIHLSFDVDGMDPSLTPSTGTPVPGGLSLRETLYLAEKIAETGRLSVLDVAEVNPALGTDDKKQMTLSNTVDVTTTFFGRHRQGNAPHGYEIPRP
ncbi:unnamed protein product [Candidula unifasciata]|uniref:Arginase n=1 Tax=Candidula unifasciata TaxID=100452 RepID=A0A8S3ZJH6_9EUPU|nr:unnamed protein product [Candidula unifasciata]